ncbi:MAG: tRNA (adenosine(37)-N6)-threonylcarbamoyltransferase complex ATPase subunit type 1 TsaE [Planctomycetota bacterium]
MSSIAEPSIFQTSGPEETGKLGEALGASLQPGVFIALVGQLGAGKTHLVKGIAGGNGLADVRKVTSPTFALVHEYPCRLKMFHVDVYRLGGVGDLESIGFEEFPLDSSVVVMEWADRVEEAVPADHMRIRIKPLSETTREFVVDAGGARATACLQDWIRKASVYLVTDRDA